MDETPRHRTRIIAVIQDRAWLEETRQSFQGKGISEVPEWVQEDFNEDLVIVHAVDSEHSLRYLSAKDLVLAKVGRPELREMACGNLRNILPKIEPHGGDGLHLRTAGGNP